MTNYRNVKILFVVLGAAVPLAIILTLSLFDMGAVFDSWGEQPNGSFVYPDWRYVLLIIFKLAIYLFPPLIGIIGFCLENRDNVQKRVFLYYFIRALNVHFLILLCIKLLADSILELDTIWNLTLFASIKDVQTLIGYIITLLIKQTIKIEPGINNKEHNS